MWKGELAYVRLPAGASCGLWLSGNTLGGVDGQYLFILPKLQGTYSNICPLAGYTLCAPHSECYDLPAPFVPSRLHDGVRVTSFGSSRLKQPWFLSTTPFAGLSVVPGRHGGGIGDDSGGVLADAARGACAILRPACATPLGSMSPARSWHG